jgi:ribosome-binding factor A
MSGKRTQRVGDLLRDEIADILRTSMRDPRLELVGVTEVEVSGDLQHAKVFMSSADPQAEMEGILRVLRRAAGFIRSELSRRRLDLRHLPELEFIHDRSIARGSRIEEILRSIHASDSPGNGGAEVALPSEGDQPGASSPPGGEETSGETAEE